MEEYKIYVKRWTKVIVSQIYNIYILSAVKELPYKKSTSVTHHLTTQLPLPLTTKKLVLQFLHFDPQFRLDLVAIVTGVGVWDGVGVHVDIFRKFFPRLGISLRIKFCQEAPVSFPVFKAHALLAHALLPDPVLGNGVTAGVVPLFVRLLRRLRGLLSPLGWDTVVVVLAGFGPAVVGEHDAPKLSTHPD